MQDSARPLLSLAKSSEIPWVDLRGDDRARLYPLEVNDRSLLIIDDGEVAPYYGGNKTRKLEFLLAEALQSKVKKIWTVGAVGSNHVLATAVHAKRLGLPVGALHFEQDWTQYIESNLLAVHAQGAELEMVDDVGRLAEAAADKRRSIRLDPEQTWIPAGGSSALGAIGYANAVLEVAQDEPTLNSSPPERLFVTAGTAGTMAGIIVGMGLAGWSSCEVIGVRVTASHVCSQQTVQRLLDGQLQLLSSWGINAPATLPDWRLEHGYFEPGYGVPSKAAREAVELGATRDLPLETTYTGRTFAAAVAAIRRDPGRSVAFWHTLNARPLETYVAAGRSELDSLPAAHRAWLDRHSRLRV